MIYFSDDIFLHADIFLGGQLGRLWQDLIKKQLNR